MDGPTEEVGLTMELSCRGRLQGRNAVRNRDGGPGQLQRLVSWPPSEGREASSFISTAGSTGLTMW